MKFRDSILSVACLGLILTACRHAAPEGNGHTGSSLSPARAAAKGHPKSIIELTDGHDSVCGPWRLVVSPEDGSVSVSRLSATGSVTIRPEGWRASRGAFVFVEGDERVWAYDGGEDLFMVVATTEGLISYGPRHFPCGLPQDVASRLPSDTRERIRGN